MAARYSGHAAHSSMICQGKYNLALSFISQILYTLESQAKKRRSTRVLGSNSVGKTCLMRAIPETHSIASRAGQSRQKRSGSYGLVQTRPTGYCLCTPSMRYFSPPSAEENLQTGYSCQPIKEHIVWGYINEIFPVLKKMASR